MTGMHVNDHETKLESKKKKGLGQCKKSPLTEVLAAQGCETGL